MRKLSFAIILTIIVSNSWGQIDLLKKKQNYKVEGYVLVNSDTIKGTISIPIRHEDLDYNSLATSIVFTDSLNTTKKYRPKNIAGFGLSGDAVFGDYVSISLPDSPDNYLFLKKVLAGKITLYENNLDRTVIRQTPTRYDKTGPGNYVNQKQSIDESIYYLQKNNEPLIKIQFDPKTSSIKKKDLKKLIGILPENFTNSEEEINVSEFLAILSNYNSKDPKE